ncbi:MAG: LytTR family DNA-binding domain-containing protein [Bacteroidota bacterium]
MNVGFDWFGRPFYFEEDWRKRLRLNALIATFVFGFLFIFRPFRIGEHESSVLLLCLGYGGVAFLVCGTWMLLFPRIFPRWFDNEKWTTGREIIYLSSLVFTIGAVNLLYSNLMGAFALTWADFQTIQLYTLSLAIFPIIVITFFVEKRQTRRHTLLSDSISSALEKQESTSTNQNLITLTASNDESIQLAADQIFYLKSDANYIEVFHQKEDTLEKELLRNTLKSIADQLSDENQFFRCHRSYLVNLDKVVRISGNAQGLKLHLKDVDDIVPVSRKHNDFLKNRFAIHP